MRRKGCHTVIKLTTLFIYFYFSRNNYNWLIHHFPWSGQEGCSGNEFKASSAIKWFKRVL